MTLRDLSITKMEKLQTQCVKEFEAWARNRNYVDKQVEDAWKQAWSNGLKAGLALIDVASE